MKKVRFLVLVLLLAFCLTACSSGGTEQVSVPNSASDETIFVDTETGVMYLWVTGSYKGGLSVMVQKDGLPKIYNEDTNTYDNITKISDETIYLDAETGVMYLWVTGSYKGALAIMLQEDGSPKIYNEDTNTYKNISNISNDDIYVDHETGVKYLWVTGSYKGDLKLMIQADGTPKS